MKTFLVACIAAIAIVIGTANSAATAQTAGAAVLAHIIAGAPRSRRLNTKQLMAKLAIRSRETIRKLEKQPTFPKPVYDAGSPLKFYFEDEVDQYLQQLAEARDAKRLQPVEESGGCDDAGAIKVSSGERGQETIGIIKESCANDPPLGRKRLTVSVPAPAKAQRQGRTHPEEGSS